jgi:hypothetical protein
VVLADLGQSFPPQVTRVCSFGASPSVMKDGEGVLRGFINTADTPHFELVNANRAAAYGLYPKRAADG